MTGETGMFQKMEAATGNERRPAVDRRYVLWDVQLQRISSQWRIEYDRWRYVTYVTPKGQVVTPLCLPLENNRLEMLFSNYR